MKRYYILMNKAQKTEGVEGDPYFVTEWYVVPKRGEPIGDNLFYTKRKWCGADYLELYDTPTGTYILRARTRVDLETKITSEKFQIQLEQVRKSDFYKLILKRYNKALNEYKERVKGGNKND